MLSKYANIFLAAALLLTGVCPAFAKGPQDVSSTIHNMSNAFELLGSPYDQYWTNEDEVCIFCHTPHGGSLTGPLWNRSLTANTAGPSGYFTHYNSTTLTSAAGAGSRAVNDESLLCMACHDGGIAPNRVLNPSNDLPDTGSGPGQPTHGGTDTEIIGEFFGQRVGFARIGGGNVAPGGTGDLSDDHPISFSYYDAELEETSSGANGLNPPATATAAGIRFFGSAGAGGLRVECSSCHDPHVAYDTGLSASADPSYAPFLITSNAGSKLCLACHNK